MGLDQERLPVWVENSDPINKPRRVIIFWHVGFLAPLCHPHLNLYSQLSPLFPAGHLYLSDCLWLTVPLKISLTSPLWLLHLLSVKGSTFIP